MKKILGAFAAIAFLAAPGLAMAEEITGTVASVDEEAQTFTLETGETLTLGAGVMLEGIEPGTEVTVSYEIENGDWVASSVEPAAE